MAQLGIGFMDAVKREIELNTSYETTTCKCCGQTIRYQSYLNQNGFSIICWFCKQKPM